MDTAAGAGEVEVPQDHVARAGADDELDAFEGASRVTDDALVGTNIDAHALSGMLAFDDDHTQSGVTNNTPEFTQASNGCDAAAPSSDSSAANRTKADVAGIVV